MDRREFVEHCVLQREMKPADAVALWNDTQAELTKTTAYDKRAPGPFLDLLYGALANMPPGTRRTVFALLAEDFNLKTGESRDR